MTVIGLAALLALHSPHGRALVLSAADEASWSQHQAANTFASVLTSLSPATPEANFTTEHYGNWEMAVPETDMKCTTLWESTTTAYAAAAKCEADDACTGVSFDHGALAESWNIATYNGFLTFVVAPFIGCAAGGPLAATGWYYVAKPAANATEMTASTSDANAILFAPFTKRLTRAQRITFVQEGNASTELMRFLAAPDVTTNTSGDGSGSSGAEGNCTEYCDFSLSTFQEWQMSAPVNDSRCGSVLWTKNTTSYNAAAECDQDEACLGVMFKYDDRPRWSISTYNGFLSFLVAPFEGCGGSVSASGGAVGWFTIPKPEASNASSAAQASNVSAQAANATGGAGRGK